MSICQLKLFVLQRIYMILLICSHNNMQNWLKDIETITPSAICIDLKTIKMLLNQFSLMLTPLSEQFQDSMFVNQIDEEIQGNIKVLNNLYKILLEKCNFGSIEVKLNISDVYQAKYSYKTLKSMMQLSQNCQNQIDQEIKRRKPRYVPREKNRGPYRSYTVDQKNHVVKLYQMGMTFASISKALAIPQKNVVRWCREGFAGKEVNKRLADSSMEKKLAIWLRQHPKREQITSAEIQQKALNLSSNPLFKASRGWLKNFIRRFEPQISCDDQSQMKKEN